MPAEADNHPGIPDYSHQVLQVSSAEIIPLRPGDGLTPADVERYLSRYTNPTTIARHRETLTGLCAALGWQPAATWGAGSVLAWITRPRADGRPTANNTVRIRFSVARCFLRWQARAGVAVAALIADLEDSPVRASHPMTYGKQQAAYPARWLTTVERDRLFAACHDGTALGLRDELAIRLGVLTLRAEEIRRLTVGAVRGDELTYTGKKNRPQTKALGPNLRDLLDRWLTLYAGAVGAPEPTDPLVCRSRRGASQEIDFGAGFSDTQPIRNLVALRARRADLGHVAPHDLRRTAAGLMHHATTPDGAHLMDLRDIQMAMGHAHPETTVNSYLNPLDRAPILRRAAAILD